MDPRRLQRELSNPKVRQVGFFARDPAPPDATNTATIPPVASPSYSPPAEGGNSLSPVIIPPPRHHPSTAAAPFSPLRPPTTASEFFPASSPSAPSASFSDDVAASWSARVGVAPPMSSGSSGAAPSGVPASELTTVSVVNFPPGVTEKGGRFSAEVQTGQHSRPKSLTEKTSKAERRALQESQRAAKAAAKGGAAVGTSGTLLSANAKSAKATPLSSQRTDGAPPPTFEKKGSDRSVDKDRKKDVPQPRMQYDDKGRVEKAKKRAVVKQMEARNRVELFRHLPQYECGTLLPDLETRFFQLDPMHPAVYKVGLQYLSGDISGGNARCIAMLQAFQEAIKDYSTPPEKTLSRDLTAKIGSFVSFLIECRALSISMGNTIRFLKNRIAKLPLTMSESEAKSTLLFDIDHFVNEKIILADKVIVNHAVTKIRDGDVLLTYGSSSVVEMILLHAHELGKHFRVVIVDSRPKLEGQLLLHRLVQKGLSCTYTHINAAAYIMHEVNRVFLGASSVLSNGTVYSRVGTACVAMVAHAFQVPVLVCCEAYKFHERVQLDSICSNELGDPNAISKVHGREEIHLNGWAKSENLQLLNLIYDVTPSDYVSMIITDYGMLPPTSVPVIVREYRREHLLI